MERLVAILIAAHMVADFLLQPGWLVRNKRQAGHLLLHGAIHAVAVYAAVQAWGLWQLPALVLLSHVAIDAIRVRRPDTASSFVADQAGHVAALIGAAALLRASGVVDGFGGCWYAAITGFGGFVATVHGSRFLLDKVSKAMQADNNLDAGGLESGARIIGQLERALIFAFVLCGYWDGVGFLAVAKAILRSRDTADRRLAEYDLIGALSSFGLAILLSAATKWAMGL